MELILTKLLKSWILYRVSLYPYTSNHHLKFNVQLFHYGQVAKFFSCGMVRTFNPITKSFHTYCIVFNYIAGFLNQVHPLFISLFILDWLIPSRHANLDRIAFVLDIIVVSIIASYIDHNIIVIIIIIVIITIIITIIIMQSVQSITKIV